MACERTGLLPQYDIPGVRISERVSLDEIYLTIEIEDFALFLSKLHDISLGGKFDLVRFRTKSDRQIWIRFINRDREDPCVSPIKRL